MIHSAARVAQRDRRRSERERVVAQSEREPSFLVSLIKDKSVLHAGAKSGAGIANAWRRLKRAALYQASPFIEGSWGRERPLASMRDIGVDFRGFTGILR